MDGWTVKKKGCTVGSFCIRYAFCPLCMRGFTLGAPVSPATQPASECSDDVQWTSNQEFRNGRYLNDDWTFTHCGKQNVFNQFLYFIILYGCHYFMMYWTLNCLVANMCYKNKPDWLFLPINGQLPIFPILICYNRSFCTSCILVLCLLYFFLLLKHFNLLTCRNGFLQAAFKGNMSMKTLPSVLQLWGREMLLLAMCVRVIAAN